ncbi:MAG: protein kinase, partial [Lentisphaeria bacterium]|nr:protein kinase [Lentisphaeria bacterium]
MLKLFCKQCNQKVDAIPLETPDADFIATCPHCVGRLSPHRVLPPGTVVNGFRIEREIGRGGMGIVYQAKQLDLDRDIALKVLSDEMASDESFIKAFFREARGAAALNHPNIVQAIDAGVAGDIHYFVMELIEGKNLEVYTVRNGALPIPLALKCATSIADALSYAWEFKHLAHRDIKPENIIMKNNSEFKLADLGLVKDCKDTSAEQDENLMATPAYAPPEIIRGEKDVPGFKSDMYSFGATLYQLFAGHAPFVADDPMVVCEMQQDNQPKPLIGLNWNIPQDISILVDKLMEKDPAKRPASWNQVLHDLNRITYNWHMTHNADGTKKKTEPAEPALPTDDQQSLHSHPILLETVVFLAILLIADLILTLCLPEKSGSAEKKVAPIASRQIIAPEQTVLPEPEQPEPEITVQTIAAPEQPPAEPAVEPEPVIKKEETIDDLPDDPDELKNWKRNYKAVLPEEPYARWEMVEEYLEDNLYAPQEARQMLKKLEEGPKKRFQQKLDELLRLTRSSVTYETTVRHGSALLKMAEEAPRWTEGILSADEAKIIRKNVETCRAALDQQAAELKKFREEQQKSLQRQKEQRLLEEAEKEL